MGLGAHNLATKMRSRRVRFGALAVTALIGLVACSESSSSTTESTGSVAARTKNAALATCTFDLKCSVGATGAAGGLVIYNSPTNFTCGPTGPVALPCNFLEIAKPDWGIGLLASVTEPYISKCSAGPRKIDLACSWSAGEVTLPTTTKSDLGASKKNYEAVKGSGQDIATGSPALSVAAAYVSPSASAGVEANPFSLPSLAELFLVCNYANGSPLRIDGCRPDLLKPGFHPEWYWSSTVSADEPGQPVWAVNFMTGESRKFARQTPLYVRPSRAFFSTLDVPAATTGPTTLPPTTVTTAAPTTIAATTVAPTVPSTAPTNLPATTVAPVMGKNCDPASPCKIGDTTSDGGTVFYYSPTGFNCDATLSTTGRQCNMLAVANPGWYAKAKAILGSSASCSDPAPGRPDPACTWSTGTNADFVTATTKSDIGSGAYNAANLGNFFKTTNRISIASLAKAYAGQDGKTAGYALPTSRELNLLCNWVNGNPVTVSYCRSTGRLKPGFAAARYWSSTLVPSSAGLKAVSLDFGNGMEMGSYRTSPAFIRPVRAFRGYPDPSLIPATTTTSTTVAPTSTVALTCAQGGVCKVDDVGPGGGKIFYAGTPFRCGPNLDRTCKYMEAAPESWSAPAGVGCSGTGLNMSCQWPTNTSNDRPATEKTLGAGAKNTAAMYAFSPTGAAATVKAYNGGGKTDWFIPSYDETNEFCKWAHFGSSGQTISDPSALCKISFHMAIFYNRPPLMTSTDSSAENAFSYLINATGSTGPLIKDAPKTDGYMVWPIRAF